MGSLSALLVAGSVAPILYVLLMCSSAAVAMASKRKFRRDMAWKVFHALVRHRPTDAGKPPP
ncbi:hypothetical protein Misp01_77440 [Microtetraspora sp. NBRC 13810]|uniref:hypothetical protein n=1 Tax=Microtetraspora sp. NBRC 13810 TaxID=3030990 RepID=UPI0024A4ED88|nr:hypothetical protein [Microtetraspora sp. NBRC 13810]GLW12616.1 hypothetical protein Misp01_77440 [Microtetraspora sp. NBRC 13810]